MITVRNVFDHLNKLADIKLAEKWDNVGLMLGDFNSEVKNVLVCLDVTTIVVNEAITNNIDLIISHHPLIFKPLKSLDFTVDFKSNIIKNLIKNFYMFYLFSSKTPHLLHRVPMERPPSQQDSHRFHHERAARCPSPFFSAWVATRFLNTHQLMGEGSAPFRGDVGVVVWGQQGPLGGGLPVHGRGPQASQLAAPRLADGRDRRCSGG